MRSPSLDNSKRKFSQAKIIHGTGVPMVPAATNVRAGPDRRLPRDRARPSLPYLVTLSLIPSSRSSCSGWIPTTRINYGLNKLRFPTPLPFGSRLRAKAAILDLRDVLAGVAVTIRYALGDRRRPPTRERRRNARRGVPTQHRRHHRDVYRLTFPKSARRSVRPSMDQPSSAGPGASGLNAPIGGRRRRHHPHLPHQRTVASQPQTGVTGA